jgi:hypothetical protein
MAKNSKKIGLFILVWICFSIAGIHNESKINDTWHSPYFSDQAGYYVYLPLVFNFHLDVKSMPTELDEKFGRGFKIDRKNGTIKNVYPCGVAILQSPFFAAASIYYYIENVIVSGFEKGFQYASVVGANFYLLLGFLFIFKYLRIKGFEKLEIILTLILLLISTNIFFYIKEVQMMSHLYSFCVFSMLLYFSYFAPSIKRIIIIAILIGLIFQLRNINIVLVPFFYIFNKNFKSYLFFAFKPKNLIVLSLIFLITIAPQLAYWKWAHNKWIVDSYEGQTFSNLLDPKISEVLIIPGTNGHFLFNPIMIILLVSSFFLILKKKWEYSVQIITFLILTVIFACWFSPGLGCGFGNRGFLELYALFAIVFAVIVKYIFTSSFKIKVLLSSIIGICCFINLKAAINYEGCYYGSKYDLNEYLRLVLNHEAEVKPIDIQNKEFILTKNDSIKTVLVYNENNYNIGKFYYVSVFYDIQTFKDSTYTFITRESKLSNTTTFLEKTSNHITEQVYYLNMEQKLPVFLDYLKCTTTINFISKDSVKIKINKIIFN